MNEQWRPIETAPNDSRPDILLYCSDTNEQFVGWRVNDTQWLYAAAKGGVRFYCTPSHWMPLPKPPQETT